MFLLMLIIKKIINFFAFILSFFLLSMSFSVLSAEADRLSPEQLIAQVDALVQTDLETLNYRQIVALGNAIIIQRSLYPSETLAKTYLLLANVANNKGEFSTGFQFIQDGLAISSVNEQTNLDLYITQANIHNAQNQGEALLSTADKIIDRPNIKEITPYYLLAMGYRSLALIMLNQHKIGLADLQKTINTANKHTDFNENIALLSILAKAYFHLGDYQATLTIQLKILALRFELARLGNVNHTYQHIANIYYRLHRFDDAYNAYWEAKKHAEKKQAPIFIAHATKGLGLTLFQQKNYAEAAIKIQAAKSLFYQNNLASPFLETLVILAQISKATGQENEAINRLLEAEQTAKNIKLTNDYAILYKMLAQLYLDRSELNKAYFWQKEYSNSLLRSTKTAYYDDKLPPLTFLNANKVGSVNAGSPLIQSTDNITQPDEIQNFPAEANSQPSIVYSLSLLIFALSTLVLFLWLKPRQTKQNHNEVVTTIPSNINNCPIQTKKCYQKHVNMAKHFNYPLTLGYISISNWQDLTHQFNKRVVTEITDEIANLIGIYISEFDDAGLINEGEYLIFFVHQHQAEAEFVMEKIAEVLRLRFFANLGNFSLAMNYSVASPNFTDSEPEVSLSHLRDIAKII